MTTTTEVLGYIKRTAQERATLITVVKTVLKLSDDTTLSQPLREALERALPADDD